MHLTSIINTYFSDPVVSRAPVDLYEPLRTTQSQDDSSSSASSSATPAVSLPEMLSTPSLSVSNINSGHKKPVAESVTQDILGKALDVSMLNSCFIEDVNVPDGTVLVPQAQFLKIWKMSNNGSIAVSSC
jgi:hypothetical protein